MKRAARYADGWHPLGTVDTAELRPPEFAKMRDDLFRMAEAFGRDPKSIDLAFVARLRDAGYTDAELLDLTVCVAGWLALGRTLHVLGVDDACALGS